MKRPSWLALSLAARRLPVVPTLAVVLLVGAAVLRWQVLPSVAAEEQRVHQAVLEARSQESSTRALARAVPMGEAQRWQAFLNTLGPSARSEEQLRTLFLIAEDTGLTLKQADYREVVGTIDGVRILEISLPVKGRYEQVRAFVEQLLSKVPFSSLDSIRIARANAGEPQVEAKLRISIYLNENARRRPSEDRDDPAAPGDARP